MKATVSEQLLRLQGRSWGARVGRGGLRCLLLLAVQFAAPRPLFAATSYYVSRTGSNTNPGTFDAPWRTIQKAANVVPPGSTVYVRGGVYYEAVTVRVSGSAGGGYVTFRPYPGERAILDGTGLAVPDADTGMFLLNNRSYVAIQGFEIRNYKTSLRYRVPVGIYIRGA